MLLNGKQLTFEIRTIPDLHPLYLQFCFEWCLRCDRLLSSNAKLNNELKTLHQQRLEQFSQPSPAKNNNQQSNSEKEAQMQEELQRYSTDELIEQSSSITSIT